MKRAKLNAKIAKHYGFTRHPTRSINYPDQWSYPADFPLAQGGVPNFTVPDFVQFLDDYLELLDKHQHGGPREYFKDKPYERSTSTHVQKR